MPGFPDAMPVQGLIGGILIGLAAAVLLLGSARIAGISGLVARAIFASPRDGMAIGFVIALIIGAGLASLTLGPIEARFPPGMGYLIAGGLLVGFGTRLGSGCTSGHGVCGMSRFSPRSITATVTFMAVGIATVATMNALGLGWS